MKNIKKSKVILFIGIILCFVGITSIVYAENLADRLSGRILLQVEQNGEAWYVSPTDGKRYFLGRPVNAFEIMRKLGLGISDKDLGQIPMAQIQNKVNAKEVVENYVKYTLNTPANYDLAKQYLTPELQSQFYTTPGFVPRSYGIQDVPYSTTVNAKNVSDNQATIQVIGQYDLSQVIWEFTVIVYNNEWKISAISKK